MKKYIFLLLLGATFTLNAQEIELDIPVVTQEQSKWCGAAVSRSVLKYLPPNRLVQQCAIMEWVRQGMGSNNCCAVPGNCNDGINLYGSRSIQSILSYFGGINSNPYSSNFPPPAEIYTYLSNNRPLIIKVWTLNYEFHAVIVRGIYLYSGLDVIYYMNPSSDQTYGGNKEVSYLNLISGFNSPYTWLETLTPCSSSREDPCDDGGGGGGTLDHCKNKIRDADETGIDCGGNDCPACTLCNNCILDPGEDAMDCGGSCTPCKYVGGMTDELTITNTAQLSWEVKAFNKITAGGATTVVSGNDVTFITEPTGSIVLLPGFKAEEGSKFRTQTKNLNKRLCGAICGGHTLTTDHKAWYDYLQIKNLNYAIKIGYDIYKTVGYAPKPIISKNFDINSDGTVNLWDCLTNAGDGLTGTVRYKIVYSIEYCNNTGIYSVTHYFNVNYSYYKSLTEDPEDPEDIDTPQSSSPDNLKIQANKSAPSLSILPNPNPGTFQLETNFPLSNIGNLKITNLMGATVYETQNVVSNTVQLPRPTAGTFFVVMVLKDGGVLTRKMVVQ